MREGAYWFFILYYYLITTLPIHYSNDGCRSYNNCKVLFHIYDAKIYIILINNISSCLNFYKQS